MAEIDVIRVGLTMFVYTMHLHIDRLKIVSVKVKIVRPSCPSWLRNPLTIPRCELYKSSTFSNEDDLVQSSSPSLQCRFRPEGKELRGLEEVAYVEKLSDETEQRKQQPWKDEVVYLVHDAHNEAYKFNNFATFAEYTHLPNFSEIKHLQQS